MKNVNKQLKSADFLSEASKFRKILLNKVLAKHVRRSPYSLLLRCQLLAKKMFVVEYHFYEHSIMPIWIQFFVENAHSGKLLTEQAKTDRSFGRFSLAPSDAVDFRLLRHLYFVKVTEQAKMSNLGQTFLSSPLLHT